MPFSFDEKYDCEIRIVITNNRISARYYFLQYGKFVNTPLNSSKHTFRDVLYDSNRTTINELFPITIDSFVNDLINDELLNNIYIKIESDLDINSAIEKYLLRARRTKYEKVNITLK